ncbi:hypothetical protein MXD63_46325, partial [Frankia sp. Cpl3]|nr:hypothetical protein [Frankia sp. Cpl3]
KLHEKEKGKLACSGKYDHTDQACRNQTGDIGPNHQLSGIVPIGQHTAEHVKKKTGNHLRYRDQTERSG